MLRRIHFLLAFVLCWGIAIVLTPPDPLARMMVGFPLFIMYCVSYWIFNRNRKSL